MSTQSYSFSTLFKSRRKWADFSTERGWLSMLKSLHLTPFLGGFRRMHPIKDFRNCFLYIGLLRILKFKYFLGMAW